MSKFTNGKSVYQDSTDSGSEDGSVAPMDNSLESPSSFSATYGEIPGSNHDINSLGKITKPNTLLKGNLLLCELFAFFYLLATQCL